jgi:hypothetical protein
MHFRNKAIQINQVINRKEKKYKKIAKVTIHNKITKMTKRNLMKKREDLECLLKLYVVRLHKFK